MRVWARKAERVVCAVVGGRRWGGVGWFIGGWTVREAIFVLFDLVRGSRGVVCFVCNAGWSRWRRSFQCWGNFGRALASEEELCSE